MIAEELNGILPVSYTPLIDKTLGQRCSSIIGYQYSEIIRSLMSVSFCGGSCVEDVTSHLMRHLSYQMCIRDRAVKLRLLEPMQAGNIVVAKNTLVAGTAKVQGERLDILAVSYTHLDVYKRQARYFALGTEGIVTNEDLRLDDGQIRIGNRSLAMYTLCLLYTSRCV